MTLRPWPLIVIALLQITVPIVNVIVCAWILGTTPLQFILDFRPTPWQFFEFYLSFPLAGIAVFAMKRWSYIVFMALSLVGAITNYIEWRDLNGVFSVTSLVIVYAVNALVVGYFLLPSVRSVYLNPRVRWWESKPRYRVEIESDVTVGENTVKAAILDISEGGALMRGDFGESASRIRVRFPFQNDEIDLPAEVMHSHRSEDFNLYGVRFEASKEQKKLMRNFVETLDAHRVPRRPTYDESTRNLKKWLMEAGTLKGWVPPSTARR